MSELAVAIPSAGREHKLAQATLPLLLRGGIDPTAITVFVPDAAAAKAYRDTVGTKVNIVHGHGLGMREARNAIAKFYPVGTPLVQVDDDITNFFRFVGRDMALQPLDDGELAGLWASCGRSAGGHLWCWYPVANSYFMRDRIRRGSLWYAVGALFGYTVLGDDAELVYVDDKEDFERSIRFYLRDGEVVRFDMFTFATKYYNEPGGMQLYRTAQTIEDGARTLAESYPEHARFYRKKDGRAEIKLRP